ncbi:unnamed protein product [Schistosoma mattheei]|uniref:Tetraspanin n=1 Tax=Schistosoma mattheei TaxID=31246 RepID=A0AA85BDV7_9TREM|nr:unnamed protein product [Schistosoma mattheei]
MKLSLSEQGWNRLFLILNGVFLVYSIMLFALGIKAQDNLRQFKTILQGINPPILPTIIFTGFIGIIGSITGYCKIMKPNQIVIILHITCMTIATMTELCISLGTVMTPNEFITNANYTLKDSLNYYDIHPLYHEQFEQLQTDYKCCGSSMFTDYRRTNNSLPASCKNNETIYTMGCAEVLNNYTYKYIDGILALCFIFTMIKIIYILISIWMIRRSSTGKDPHILECC